MNQQGASGSDHLELVVDGEVRWFTLVWPRAQEVRHQSTLQTEHRTLSSSTYWGSRTAHQPCTLYAFTKFLTEIRNLFTIDRMLINKILVKNLCFLECLIIHVLHYVIVFELVLLKQISYFKSNQKFDFEIKIQYQPKIRLFPRKITSHFWLDL